MHFSNWLVFCGVAFLVCFSPGPGVLLAISNAMAHGKRDWVASSLGNATGLFIISGVATLAASSSRCCCKMLRPLKNRGRISVCRKSLAEFAPAGANKALTIFSGDVCVGENTLWLANARA